MTLSMSQRYKELNNVAVFGYTIPHISPKPNPHRFFQGIERLATSGGKQFYP